MVYILQLLRAIGVSIIDPRAYTMRKGVRMKRISLWVGICAVISTLVGLFIFSSHDPKWPEQGNFEQHG